jgi:hypothetical protein
VNSGTPRRIQVHGPPRRTEARRTNGNEGRPAPDRPYECGSLLPLRPRLRPPRPSTPRPSSASPSTSSSRASSANSAASRATLPPPSAGKRNFQPSPRFPSSPKPKSLSKDSDCWVRQLSGIALRGLKPHTEGNDGGLSFRNVEDRTPSGEHYRIPIP